MKLNLGCGRKPLEGYVNVDLHVPTDLDGFDYVQDDVTNLSEIEDGSCSEIIAYHLIEHIPPSKVPVMLWTWCNKLMMGGQLIIECPDIIKCCINVLSQMTHNDDFTTHRLGLIGIFGEEHVANPHMTHLWGYSQASLSSLLYQAGFSMIDFEDPISKPDWSRARDMRCVALK